MLRYYLYRPGASTPYWDPDRTAEKLTGVSWGSMWPKGYSGFEATVRRDVLKAWQVRTGDRIIARDGQRTIYDGRLIAPKISQSNGSPITQLMANGWYEILNQRSVRKRWIDKNPFARFVWPDGTAGTGDQEKPNIKLEDRNSRLRIELRQASENLTVDLNPYQEQYVNGQGPILSISYDFLGQTGQSFRIRFFNDDNSGTQEGSHNHVSGLTGFSGSHAEQIFTQGDTKSFTMTITPGNSGFFDSDQWLELSNMVVKTDYATGHRIATPTYSINELIEDVLLYVRGSDLSADMTGLAGPGTTLDHYLTRDDSFQTASDIIEDLLGLSDVAKATYGLAVWGGGNSNDGLPQVYVSKRDITTPNHVLDFADLDDWDLEMSVSELYNWITVEWVDERGVKRFASPDTHSELKDEASIATYGERHNPKPLNAGETTEAKALLMGQRYLDYHKDPLVKGSFSLSGPLATRINAGDVVELQGGRGSLPRDLKIFLRETSYDVERNRVTLMPDIPPDYSTREADDVAGRHSFEG